MKIGGIIIGAACALFVPLLSVHIFFNPAPEFHITASTDGLVVLEGHVYESQRFFLEEKVVSEVVAPLSSARYVVQPVDAFFSEPLTASFFLRDTQTTLYKWNEGDGYWTALPEHQKDDLGYAHVLLSSGGTYALGTAVSVQAPTFVDVVSDLRSRLSQDVTSYYVELIAEPEGGIPVLLPAFLERGGCGGVPAVGEERLVMQDSRTAEVLVNDVLTRTQFTFLMHIETLPGGCPEDMPLQVIF